jgi:2-polyprenyl-3-methyl-5-hydroxy-6-metoxy-1,4-benzoquinol methylase
LDASQFDQAYYDRYYFNPRTRIAEPGYFDRVADFVGAYLKLLDCPVGQVLDVGCGAGLLHPGLRRAFPRLRLTGIDASPWACARYGWHCIAIEEYRAARRFDLVICHDVLQYLDDTAAGAALAKLCALTRGAFFFSVLTREDWDTNCDQRLTDGNVHLRSADWYRSRLSGSMANAGGGLYLRRDAPVVLYSLEHC